MNATLAAIRTDIRTAYELIATDEQRATQYARSAQSAIIEASFDPEIGEEAMGLMWMITDLV
ncbi:hypothetical protein ACWDTG_06620 [Rhodococcus zopfii]